MLRLCTGDDNMLELIKKYRLLLVGAVLIVISMLWNAYRVQCTEKEAVILTQMIQSPNESIDSDKRIEPITLEAKTDKIAESELESGRETEPERIEAVSDKNEGNGLAGEALKVPVYLCGEVVKPAVYFVEPTAIIQDVVTLGGGLLETADFHQINLAQEICANQRIYIPKVGEQIDKIDISYDNKSNSNLDNDKININHASQEHLENLPGIGEVKARQIITYRTEVGAFKQCEDLMDVSGIGEKTYSMIEQLITIE